MQIKLPIIKKARKPDPAGCRRLSRSGKSIVRGFTPSQKKLIDEMHAKQIEETKAIRAAYEASKNVG